MRRPPAIGWLVVTFPNPLTWFTSSYPCPAIDQIRTTVISLLVARYCNFEKCWIHLYWFEQLSLLINIVLAVMVNLLSFATGSHQQRHSHDSCLLRCECNNIYRYQPWQSQNERWPAHGANEETEALILQVSSSSLRNQCQCTMRSQMKHWSLGWRYRSVSIDFCGGWYQQATRQWMKLFQRDLTSHTWGLTWLSPNLSSYWFFRYLLSRISTCWVSLLCSPIEEFRLSNVPIFV